MASDLVIKVSALVSLIDVEMPNGDPPEGEARRLAIEALWIAAEEADGSPTTIDGDVRLDLEGTGGDEPLAIEILTEEIERRGIRARVLYMHVCPTCDNGPMIEWCLTCKGAGEVLPGTPPAQDRG